MERHHVLGDLTSLSITVLSSYAKIYSSSSCLSSWAALLFAVSLIFLFFNFVWLPVLYLRVCSMVRIHLVPGKAFCVADASFCLNFLISCCLLLFCLKYFTFSNGHILQRWVDKFIFIPFIFTKLCIFF